MKWGNKTSQVLFWLKWSCWFLFSSDCVLRFLEMLWSLIFEGNEPLQMFLCRQEIIQQTSQSWCCCLHQSWLMCWWRSGTCLRLMTCWCWSRCLRWSLMMSREDWPRTLRSMDEPELPELWFSCWGQTQAFSKNEIIFILEFKDINLKACALNKTWWNLPLVNPWPEDLFQVWDQWGHEVCCWGSWFWGQETPPATQSVLESPGQRRSRTTGQSRACPGTMVCEWRAQRGCSHRTRYPQE